MLQNALNSRTPDWVTFENGLIKLETTNIPLENLAKQRFVWKTWATAGILVALFLMVIMTFTVIIISNSIILGDYLVPQITQPSKLLMSPSMNPLQDISAIPLLIFAFFLAVLVHELGHALVAEAEGVPVTRAGVLLLLGIPVGAYVELGEGINEIELLPYLRVVSAGILNNIAFAILGYLFLQPDFNPSIESIYFHYFDELMNGTMPAVATTVSPLEGLMFWIFIVNINFAIINSIPVFVLDGGKIVQRLIFEVTQLLEVDSHNTHFYLIVFFNFVLGLSLLVIFIGPYFL